MPKTQAKTELKTNFEAYQKMEKELLAKYYGKVAIFHHGKFIDAYNDFQDALKFATDKYGAGQFSIKEVSSQVKNLGSIRSKVELSGIS